MKYKVTGLIAVVLTSLSISPAFADGEALAQAKGCVACHAVDEKKVGPSYREVAAKYKGDAGAIDTLVTKVQAGGSGVWGQIPMPPQSMLSADEVETLVKWVLAQ